MIAAIAELCAADHGDLRLNIDVWIANKSPQDVAGWLEARQGHYLVAEDAGAVMAVGAFNGRGEVLLNYVAPEARFRGISKAMLSRMEAELRASGVREARLTSTRTAHRFYRAAGWSDAGPVYQSMGMDALPMKKRLTAAQSDRAVPFPQSVDHA